MTEDSGTGIDIHHDMEAGTITITGLDQEARLIALGFLAITPLPAGGVSLATGSAGHVFIPPDRVGFVIESWMEIIKGVLGASGHETDLINVPASPSKLLSLFDPE